ncbi:YhdP family protein [Marinomonas sp. NPDC078689]|uniref:YhdP family protein n=1 Tax=unclassified Marinomonas TaxID=196814 RepID=UPI0037C87AB3
MKKQLQGCVCGVYWFVIGVAALLAVLVVSVKLLLPCLNDYRTQIESNLSHLTGYQVTLDSIGGHLEGVDPTVSINGLVMSVNGSPAASVAEIRVRIDAIKSLLTFSPQFTYVRFVKPSLSLQERAGQWALKGSAPSSDVKTDIGVERILGYLTAQQRFSVLNANVDLVSQQYGDHSVSIPSAYIFQHTQSSWIKSTVYVDGNATPFDINAKIYQSLGVFGAYQVDASVDVPNISIPFGGESSSWAASLSDADFAGKLWLNYRVGDGLSLQAKASRLMLGFNNGETYESAPSIRVRYSQKRGGAFVDVHQLALKDEAGQVYPPINLSYEWLKTSNQSYLSFNQLDLGLAHRIAKHFLQPEWHVSKLISGLAPQGVVSNAALRLGKKGDAVSYHFLSNLQQASVAGYQGIPEVNHLNAVFSLTDGDGYIQFKQQRGELAFPTLYADKWQVSGLSGLVDWQLVQNTLVVSGRGLKIHRNGADVDGGFRFESRPNAPDWLSLSIRGQHIPIADRLVYLPENALNTELKDWIGSALSDQGEVNNLDLIIQSELADGATPDVRLKMDVSNAQLDYSKGWPVAKSLNGQFLLDESGVHVDVHSASLSDVKVSNIAVNVPIKEGKADWLSVSGKVDRDAAEALNLLRTTPLNDSVLAPFKTWTIKGNVAAEFDVSVPLNDQTLQPKATLALVFKDNPIYIGDVNLDTQVKQGEFHFSTEKGITDSHFDVRAFSGDSHLDLTSGVESDGRISVLGQLSGGVDLHQVASWQKWPEQVLSNLSGDVSYQGTLEINKSQEGQVDLHLNSDLKGGVASFPKPFSKVSTQAMPLDLKVMAHQQDVVVQGSLAGLAKVRLLVRSGALYGGDLYLNSNKALPKDMLPGLAFEGQFAAFDVAQWQAVLGTSVSNKTTKDALPNEGFKVPDWLRQVNLLVDQVVVNDQNTLHNVKLNYDVNKAKGKFQVSSDELNVKFDHDAGKPRFHFGYLNWNTEKTSAKEEADAPPFHANQIPNMRLIIDQLYINQAPYGDWNLNVIQQGNELRVDPFSSGLKKGTFDGHLVWRDDKNAPSVTLTMAVNGKDLAELTGKFSDKAFVTSKNYKINVALNWYGNPFYFDRPSLSGRIVFDAKDGNFAQVDELPGFMKIFGIFNVEALRRRLTLDFSDVYKPGLTYDRFEGAFEINKGILKTTKPLHIVSPTAEVTVEGSADIANETLDEVLTATLPITRSLPLAGLLWGTPQLAGILYLTDKLIGDKISKVTSVQYKVQGSFDEPIITPIKHKPAKRVER